MNITLVVFNVSSFRDSRFFRNFAKIIFKIMTKRNCTILILLLLIVDQVVKIWIKTTFTLDESVDVLGDWFKLRFIENPGAAYGFELGGKYGKLILSLFRVVAVSLIGYYIYAKLIPRKVNTGIIVGFVLLLAGALGNIIDCAFYGLIFSDSTPFTVAEIFPADGGYGTFLHGKVVDMLYFPIINGHYPEWLPAVGGQPFTFFSPIFNIADAYISVGVIYLLLFHSKHLK